MKKNLLLIILAILSTGVFAQAPQNFNYQAVARNSSGEILVEQSLTIRVGILHDEVLIWQEDHEVTTNAYGLFTLKIGSATNGTGTAGSFAAIDWGNGSYALSIEADTGNGFISLGTSELTSVPFAMYAANSPADYQELTLDGSTLNLSNGGSVVLSDNDPGNELQSLTYTTSGLAITNDPAGTTVSLDNIINSVTGWELNSDTIETLRPVAIGTKDTQVEEPLFEVRNDMGNPVFAVYNDGVMVFVDENKKGVKGGFAVGGYNSASKGITQEYMRITPDSVRFWVPEDAAAKGVKGGFAVGGYNTAAKGITQDLMYIHPDSIRFWVPEDAAAKGVKGGFAVGGYNSATKGTSAFNFLEVSSSETSVFFDTTNTRKGVKGGFAVGGYNSATKAGEGASQLMSLTRENYLIGENAGANLTTGRNNSLLGYESGYNLTEGRNNVFLGTRSGFKAINPYENAFIGNGSGYNTVSGYGNVFLGNQSGFLNENGNYNSFVGYQAGFAATSFYNTFFGYQSGYNNTTGKNNIAIGFRAGYGDPVDGTGITGNENIFIGMSSGFSNTTGAGNVFLGNKSGNNNITGSNNVFLGTDAGFSNETGSVNVFMGSQAGYSNTTGYSNVFLGEDAGVRNVKGFRNVFIGYQSGYNNIGDGTTWNGTYNTFIGYRAGFSNTSGGGSVIIGYSAGSSVTDENYLTAVGYSAGSGATGPYNVFVGGETGKQAGDGSDNTFVGFQSGVIADGSFNTAYGRSAGWNHDGNYNVAVGFNAGHGGTLVSFNNNVHVGSYSGLSQTSGSNNTFIGHEAGRNSTTGLGNVFIGYQAGYGATTQNNKLIINNSSDVTTPLIAGTFNSNETDPLLEIHGNLYVDNGNLRIQDDPGSGAEPLYYVYQGNVGSISKNFAFTINDYLWVTRGAEFDGSILVNSTTYSSDIRYKSNIKSLQNVLEKLDHLNGVYFNWKTEEFKEKGFENGRQIGFIAQDVESVFPELVVTGEDGYKSVDYAKITAVLIEAVKEQQTEIETQRAEIDKLKAEKDRYAELEEKIRVMEQKLTILDNMADK